MKKILSVILLAIPIIAMAQVGVDGYIVSQTDLKGTARYMSMAGAYGALGGDLTAITQNPGGIGVYRSSDFGITFDLDLQSAESRANGITAKNSQTKFYVNNFGYVGAFKLDSETLPYINFGFSYNRPVSYNRRYSGEIRDIKSSLTNYIAKITNDGGYNTNDIAFYNDYDPYIHSNAPWLSVMAYNAYVINPTTFNSVGYGSNFVGLMNNATQGFSEYEVIEKGGVDEFNVNFGGNLADMLYWGVALGVSSMEQSRYTYYGEGLTSASVPSESGTGDPIDKNGTASFGLENWLNTTGDAWNFKFGVIFKPINELRIGASIHTPTYWTLTDEIFSTISYGVENSQGNVIEGYEDANAGYTDEITYQVFTPWKFSVSAAAVVGTKGLISFDYERVAYDDMSVRYDDGWGDYYEDVLVKNDIKNVYQAMNIFRVGGEYRLTPQLSLRLGYAYQSSPVKSDAYSGKIEVLTAGTTPAYTFDKSIQYMTGGFGYKNKGFYTDFAFVHKERESQYNAFTPYVGENNKSPQAFVKDNNNEIVWTIGYRF